MIQICATKLKGQELLEEVADLSARRVKPHSSPADYLHFPKDDQLFFDIQALGKFMLWPSFPRRRYNMVRAFRASEGLQDAISGIAKLDIAKLEAPDERSDEIEDDTSDSTSVTL